MTRDIEKRLGIIVGLYRKKKVKQGISGFKQTQFIKAEPKHPFEGVALHSNVCSLATLSRLENGKHQHDYALVDYFLKKLDIQYRIKESVYQVEKSHLRNITFAFAYTPSVKLIDLFNTCEQFYQEHQDDALLILDHHVLKFIHQLFILKRANRLEFEHLLHIYDAVDPCLQDWITLSSVWLKQTHPDFWNLEFRHESAKQLSYLKDLQILLNFENDPHNVSFYPLFRSFHESSWVIHELKEALGKKDPYFSNACSEMTRCLEIATLKNLTQKGHSQLYYALHTYHHMSPNAQIKYLSDHLIDLLIHEPYPRTITKIISQNALILCQNQKSYKPLIRLLELHLENNPQIPTLSSVFKVYVNADPLT